METLEGLDRDGLEPRSGWLPPLTEAMEDALEGEAGAAAWVEILATEAFLSAVDDLEGGRLDPGEFTDDESWGQRGPESHAPMDRLREGESPSSILGSVRPDLPWYSPTRSALIRYRSIARAGGWPSVILGGLEVLRPGDSGPAVRFLRDRLKSGADLAERRWAGEGTEPLRYDQGLADAVRSFQRRHGLNVDGIVGSKTVEALNVPVEDRVAELKISLERMRWLPDSDPRYVFVNVAAFQLHVVEASRRVISMDTQVGRPDWPTAIFSDTLEYLVFNPYWHVPESIETEETLPAVREDPSYLEEQHIVVVPTDDNYGEPVRDDTIAWNSLDDEEFQNRYDFRQQPGAFNALGRIKFMFPNEHFIYLHDTPAVGLFKEAQRATSHGCIRVENPARLASYLLGRGGESTVKEIWAETDPSEPTRVELSDPIPVHVFYLTGWAEPDGTVHFRPDLYGLNDPVRQGLKEEHED